MDRLVPLNCLRTGECALVGEILGQPELVHRLREMGLQNGAEIEMVRRGNPCIIRLAGQKLCFRGDESAAVLVMPGVST